MSLDFPLIEDTGARRRDQIVELLRERIETALALPSAFLGPEVHGPIVLTVDEVEELGEDGDTGSGTGGDAGREEAA